MKNFGISNPPRKGSDESSAGKLALMNGFKRAQELKGGY
ncbi:hypothetical protein VCR26J2_350363 [Vibrio coralliirubri]|nr:hypothetical protein VCR6J2_610214 [Vibrio coralliirubri]CDT69919.1 hypothetical protein VCR26J2_350363 [Vibrio coralliirubri]CDT86722.1 hypothetical protein VCR29J2_700166 [Vibrio coralliirubri]